MMVQQITKGLLAFASGAGLMVIGIASETLVPMKNKVVDTEGDKEWKDKMDQKLEKALLEAMELKAMMWLLLKKGFDPSALSKVHPEDMHNAVEILKDMGNPNPMQDSNTKAMMLQEDELKQIFKMADKDSDGYITASELCTIIDKLGERKQIREEEANELKRDAGLKPVSFEDLKRKLLGKSK